MSDTRDQLLEAAWLCVRTVGVGGATSRAITDAAGASLGSITYHFGSKDQLLAEALTGAVRSLLQPALDALSDERSEPGARVLRAVESLQRSFDEAGDDAAGYLEVLVYARRSPAVAVGVGGLFVELRDFLSRQMGDQQESGVLPAWIDPDAMAGLFLSVALGVVLQIVVDPSGPSHRAMAAQFAQLLVGNLRA